MTRLPHFLRQFFPQLPLFFLNVRIRGFALQHNGVLLNKSQRHLLFFGRKVTRPDSFWFG
jgi:hypothetical protein